MPQLFRWVASKLARHRTALLATSFGLPALWLVAGLALSAAGTSLPPQLHNWVFVYAMYAVPVAWWLLVIYFLFNANFGYFRAPEGPSGVRLVVRETLSWMASAIFAMQFIMLCLAPFLLWGGETFRPLQQAFAEFLTALGAQSS